MRQLIIFFLFLCVPVFVNSQEDCVNGIDDDGNGLVDINDPKCQCTGNLIQNAEFSPPCSPSYPEDWGSAYNQNYATFSSCNANGIDQTTYPPPAPATEVVQLTTSGFAVAGNIYQCLDAPLVAGQSYTLIYDYAITSGILVENNPPPSSQIFVYGIPSCPSDYDANPIFCPTVTSSGNMEFIDENVFPAVFDTWNTHSITFTPSQDYEGILFSGPCWQTTGVYILTQLTNMFIEAPDYALDEPFFSDGTKCTQFTVSADLSNLEIPNLTIQWYLDGVAISGATTPDFQLPPGTLGNLTYAVTTPGVCAISEELAIPEPISLNVSGQTINNPCFEASEGSISVDVSNGLPGYTYVWNNGEITQTISDLTDGTYFVTVTDSEGCTGEQSYTITSPSELSGSIIDFEPVDPFSGLGSAIAEASNGTPNYTYLWDNGETGPIANQLTPGIHTVTITDANGCSIILEVEIPYEPIIFDLFVNPTCENQCNGSAQIIIDGGLFPYILEWEDPTLNGILPENLCAGTYNFTILDAIGTEETGSMVITEIDGLEITSVVDIPECGDTTGGNITIIPQGNGPFNYDWNTGSNSSSLTDLQPGTYSVTVADDNGCLFDSTYIIESQADFEIVSEIQQLSCPKSEDGSIMLAIESDSGSVFSYLWSNGSTSNQIDSLGPGDYNVIIEDTSGCQKVRAFTIQEPFFPSFSLPIVPTLCPGDSILIQIEKDSLEELSIEWSDGQNLFEYLVAQEGAYSFILQDSNECIIDTFVQVEYYDTINLSVTINSPLCEEDEKGSIEIDFLNETDSLIILWSTGDTTKLIENLDVGSYDLIAEDKNGCKVRDSFEVLPPALISYNTGGNLQTCQGEDSGSIEFLHNELDSLTFNWEDGSNTSAIDGLSPGLYQVTITNSQGCQVKDSFLVQEYNPLTFEESTSDETCNGENDGFIEFINLNNPITSILWDDGNSSIIRTGLSPGEYNYVITDTNSCVYDGSITIAPGFQFDIGFGLEDWPCNEPSTTLIIDPFNTNDYNIYWNDELSSETINITDPGIYNLRFIDLISGCQFDTTFNITNQLPQSFTSEVSPSSCDLNNGFIQIEVENSTDFIFAWSNGASEPINSDLEPGNYQLTLTDDNDCTSVLDFEIDNIPALDYSYDIDSIACFGDDSGNISFFPSENISEIYLNGIISGTNVTGLPAGDYLFEVIDTNGCESNLLIELIQPTSPLEATIVQLIQDQDNSGQGSAEVLAIGGTPPYNYSWDNGQVGPFIDGLSEGIYEVTVTDQNGCLRILQIEISNRSINASYLVEDNLCFNQCEGNINLDIEGGTAPYDISIVNSDGEFFENGKLCEGEYQVFIVDANGLEFQLTNIIIETPKEPFMVNIIPDLDSILVREGDDLSLTADWEEVVNVSEVNWYFDESLICFGSISDCSSIEISEGNPNQVTLIAFDENGCYASDSIFIIYEEEIGFDVPNIINLSSGVGNDIWTFWVPSNIRDINTNIFDRWGNKVYSLRGGVPYWDGHFNGRPVASGVYVFTLTYAIEGQENKISILGDLTVLR